MSDDHTPLIYAHRGASADHRENTLAAFEGAVAQGADAVELDVRVTRDGELVVLHDPRYPDGRLVWDTPAVERPDGVPLLDEALDACAPLLVNVEIKNIPGDLGDGVPHDPAAADPVVDLIVARAAARPQERILISSFDPATLGRVRERSDLATGLLVFDLSADPMVVERAVDEGHVALNPWDPFVDAALVERCRAAGLGVNTWTVDDPIRHVELAAMGVDGIITNVPAIARQALSGAD